MITKVLYKEVEDDNRESLMYSYYNNFINDNNELMKEYEDFELNQINNRLRMIKDVSSEEGIDVDINNVTSGISCINNKMVLIAEIY